VYVAQVIPQIDAEIAEKGHFWMEQIKDISRSQMPGVSALLTRLDGSGHQQSGRKTKSAASMNHPLTRA
jgi:hypothetical protein